MVRVTDVTDVTQVLIGIVYKISYIAKIVCYMWKNINFILNSKKKEMDVTGSSFHCDKQYENCSNSSNSALQDQSLYRNLSRGKEQYLRKKQSNCKQFLKTRTGQIMKEAFH